MINFPHDDGMKKTDQFGAEHPIHATPISDKDNRTLFQKFKSLARNLFVAKPGLPQTDMHLTGRIQKLQQTADEMLEKLNAIKDDLESQADPDLIGSIEAVVNQMIREVQRIQKGAPDPQNVEEQIDKAEKYSGWIERARPWFHLSSANLKDRSSIIHAVVRHAMHTTEEMIKRDLQVIQDYQQHKLSELSAGNGERKQFKNRLDESSSLARSIEDLTRLQRSEPGEVSLDELETWKKTVDDLRIKFYNQSMNAIDNVFRNVHMETAPKEQERVVSNLKRLASLEEGVMQLQSDLRARVYDEEDCYKLLEHLEKEIHVLEREIDLTPELLDRLNQARNALMIMRSVLDNLG